MSFPIPFISYRHIINKQWEYTVGMPRSELSYSLSSKSTIQSFVEGKGLNGNLGKSALDSAPDNEMKYVHIAMIGGLGYSYKLGKHLAASVESGYSLYNLFQIQDYDRNELYDFGMDNKAYFNIGLQIRL